MVLIKIRKTIPNVKGIIFHNICPIIEEFSISVRDVDKIYVANSRAVEIGAIIWHAFWLVVVAKLEFHFFVGVNLK